MEKNKVILVSIGVLLIVFVFYFINIDKEEFNNDQDLLNSLYGDIDNNVGYQDNISVEELKKETSITGNDEIYEIQKEYDGRNVLVVKPSVKYSVAFAGMIKKDLPRVEDLGQVLDDNLPKSNGVWIEESSRSRVLELFNGSDMTQAFYSVDEEGYLKVDEKNGLSDIDRKIVSAVNGDRQFVFDVSSVCYIVDDLTGEILDYNFEDLDRYQTYEYFEDNGRFVVFVTQNSFGQLDDAEIFESVVGLF